MRVGVNAYFLAHPQSGSGQYLLELARRLPQESPGWEFVWYVPAGLPVPEELAPQAVGVPVPACARGNWAKLFFEQVAFARAAEQSACDVLFVPYFGPPSRLRELAVVTVHDTIPLLLPAYRRGALARAYSGLVRANGWRCRLLLADSDWTRRDAVQLMGAHPDRVRVVPLGVGEGMRPVTDEGALAGVQERYCLPKRYLLFLAGADRRKRADVLLEAYAALLQRVPDAPDLVLAGRVPDRPSAAVFDLRALVAAAGLRERVWFIGAVEEGDKAAVYSGALAFVFPSEYEGFGLPPLEAMACGAPVVAANATSVPEVCGDAALLVPPGDAEALAEALERVIRDPDLRSWMAQRGRERAAGYTWERTARLTAQALEEAGSA